MELTTLAYAPIMEQEEEIPELNWDKSTIKYVLKNKSRIMSSIRSSVKNVYKSALGTMDIEDIYTEVIEYLYKCDDYNKEKAIGISEKNNSQTIISLEGYVGTCIKNCVKRYISTMYDREKEIVRENRDDEGKEIKVLDTVADKKSEDSYEEICYDVESSLKVLESKRYRYGADIFLVLFIRLITLGKQHINYRQILGILDISKKELTELEKKIQYDEDVLNLLKAISMRETEIAIEQIRPYIYSYNLIDKAVKVL